MKNRSILLLAGLLIAFLFSCLLVHLDLREHKKTRDLIIAHSLVSAQQLKQITVMRETATQTREAFDQMQHPHADFHFSFHSVHIVRPNRRVRGWVFPRSSDLARNNRMVHDGGRRVCL
ncbi:MAG TPA: hypothetical protein VKU00_01815 [Chthonomonadaceae bacterium]|nr:hypothetical protein [Chthonomonadaceae bacterium]